MMGATELSQVEVAAWSAAAARTAINNLRTSLTFTFRPVSPVFAPLVNMLNGWPRKVDRACAYSAAQQSLHSTSPRRGDFLELKSSGKLQHARIVRQIRH